jgi:hypothetical protein
MASELEWLRLAEEKLLMQEELKEERDLALAHYNKQRYGV